MKYNFKLKKLEGKVQINIDSWLYPDDSIIEIQKINGRKSITFITKALEIGNKVTNIEEGDILLLSKVSCEVATSPTAYYTVEGKRFFNVPIEQIMGTFKNNKISLDSLEMRPNSILFKRMLKLQDSIVNIEEKNTMLGEVVKSNNNSAFKTGDIIAVRDNVSTPIKFEQTEYFAVEEQFIVGTLTKPFSIENMKVLNQYVLMKPYISERVLNSTILETPNINYDDLDYSDINNRNLFKVYYADEALGIYKGDIILLNRDFTNYMYYENEKYFVINDKKWILGRIIERDKQ